MDEAKKLTFDLGGRIVDADTLRSIGAMQRKPKTKRDAPDQFHRGFSVEGFPPGFPEEAKAKADGAVSEWAALSERAKAEAIKYGRRAPKPWDEARWLAATKRKKVRSKPYELLSAAEECQRMAERAGWTNTTIVEVKKEKQGMRQREFA